MKVKNFAETYDLQDMKRNSLFEKRRKAISDEARKSVSMSFAIVDRIHEVLTTKGWKQKDLADKLGKSEAEISKWMRGTHNFTIDTIVAIEAALGESILKVVCSKETKRDTIRIPLVFVEKRIQQNAISYVDTPDNYISMNTEEYISMILN